MVCRAHTRPVSGQAVRPGNLQGILTATRAYKASSDILLLKARLAAEAGDAGEALRLVSAAVSAAPDTAALTVKPLALPW